MTTFFFIEIENLYDLDASLVVDDPEKLDGEIEWIVDSVWRGVGPTESLLLPFFTTFLQSSLLRPLYIYYFSLLEIKNRYDRVVINASNIILDIVAIELGVELSPERTMHDEEFHLVRHYMFLKKDNISVGWKHKLKPWVWIFMKQLRRLFGVDILYLNAGKLNEDFRRIERKLSINLIPPLKSKRLNWDLEAIASQVLDNMDNIDLSIPSECVHKLVQFRVLAYLPDLMDRIGVLVETIEALRVKLVIASAPTHEDHLCLLAAAKIAGIQSLIITHGVTFAKNGFLDDYATAQGSLSLVEPRYKGVKQFHMRYNWFERKI